VVEVVGVIIPAPEIVRVSRSSGGVGAASSISNGGSGVGGGGGGGGRGGGGGGGVVCSAASRRMPGPPRKKYRYRRDESEVSCCLKYFIFGFNVIFWVSTFSRFIVIFPFYLHVITCISLKYTGLHATFSSVFILPLIVSINNVSLV